MDWTYYNDDGYWAVNFDGADDYLIVSGNTAPTTANFTVEFWSKFSTTSLDTVTRRIYSHGLEGTGNLQIAALSTSATINGKTHAAGALVLVVNSVNLAGTVASVADDSWHHVAFTRAGNVLYVFVDGVQKETGNITSNLNNTGSTTIGSFTTNSQGNFLGNISNLRLVIGTNGNLYTANFTPITSALTSVTGTRLLICQSRLFVDRGPNTLTVTAYGNTETDEFFIPFANAVSSSTDLRPWETELQPVLDYQFFDAQEEIATPSSNSALIISNLGTDDFTELSEDMAGFQYQFFDAQEETAIVRTNSAFFISNLGTDDFTELSEDMAGFQYQFFDAQETIFTPSSNSALIISKLGSNDAEDFYEFFETDNYTEGRDSMGPPGPLIKVPQYWR